MRAGIFDLGISFAHDHFAVWPGYRQALKVGQFAFAQGAFEVIANQAILLAHITGPVEGFGTGIIPALIVRGPDISERNRCAGPRHHHGR
jgi:hypothetical protein